MNKNGFTCELCGVQHESLPLCFGGAAPWAQMGISQRESTQRVVENDDLCVVDDEHHFLRGHIELPILNSDQVFVWSVWCSLSRESFDHVQQRWNEPQREGDGYFGWLCTSLPCYEMTTLHLPTDVISQSIGCVPLIHLHECEHPLFTEQRDGISEKRVREIAHELMCG